MKYYHRSNTVDAILYTGTNGLEIVELMYPDMNVVISGVYNNIDIPVETRDEIIYLKPGLWLIRFANGDMGVCQNFIFNAVYEQQPPQP
jgi:hypothetical protein